MMRLHVKMPSGTRIEHTELVVDRLEKDIRSVVPPAEIQGISDNIGLPISYDLAYYQTDSTGPQDADVLIQLKPKHQPTEIYENKIRGLLARDFPQVTGYFQAADIVSQVLNFGLPAAIDTQITGNNLQSDFKIASRLQQAHPHLPKWKKLAQRFDSHDYVEGLPPTGWLRVAKDLIEIKSAMS